MIRTNTDNHPVESAEPSTLDVATSAAGEAFWAATSAAEEAIDALSSVYWTDTFDCDGLEKAIAELIQTFLPGAVPLTVKRQVEEV